MTSDVLLDSCVVAKLIVPEPDSPWAERLMIETLQAGGMGLAVDFAAVEVANVIWKRYRRKIIDQSQAHQNLLDLFALPIQWNTLEPDLTRAFEIALSYQIAVYDALFVAAAEMIDVPAVTSDVALFNRVASNHPRIQLLTASPLP